MADVTEMWTGEEKDKEERAKIFLIVVSFIGKT